MAEQIPLKAVKSSGVATALAEMATGDYAGPAYLPPIFTDYISGLVMTWISGTSISISSGACYVPSLGYVLAFPATITKSGLSLSASTWYHVYGYLNGSAPDIEISTIAPAAAYAGVARAKTGDTSRRYIGSMRTDSGSQVFNFLQIGDQIAYRNAQANAPFRVLAVGTSTSSTSVNCSAVVPVTSRLATLQLYNFADGVNMGTGTSDDSAAGPPSAPNDAIFLVRGGATAMVPHPLAADGTLLYWLTGTPTGGAGAYIDVFGYTYQR